MIRRSRVVIVICAGPRDDRAHAGRRRADRADRERARLGRRAGGGTGRRDSRGARARGGRRRSSLYTGTFENYQGLDLLYARDGASSCARGRTRGSSWSAASRRRSSARAARGRRRWALGDAACLHRPAARRRSARVPRRGDRARLAAIDRARTRRSRSTSTCDRAGRSSPPTCGRTRRCSSDEMAFLAEPTAGGVWRGDSRGDRRSRTRAPAIGARARALAETQVQRRGVHRQDQRSACGLLVERRRAEVAQGVA